MKASTTCLACGYREADADLIELEGLVVGTAFTCRACGAMSAVFHDEGNNEPAGGVDP